MGGGSAYGGAQSERGGERARSGDTDGERAVKRERTSRSMSESSTEGEGSVHPHSHSKTSLSPSAPSNPNSNPSSTSPNSHPSNSTTGAAPSSSTGTAAEGRVGSGPGSGKKMHRERVWCDGCGRGWIKGTKEACECDDGPSVSGGGPQEED